MPIYPFCTISDTQAFTQHRPAYSASTKPTSDQVNEFIAEIRSRIQRSLIIGGYDVDNLHEYKTSVAAAITQGNNVDLIVANVSGIAAGDVIKLEGTSSGALKWEFCNVISVTGTTVRLATVVNNYDAGCYAIVVNHSLRILKTLNAIGSAAMAEENTFMGTSPNKSEHAETLWKHFNGSKDNPEGLWAIEHVEDYLPDAETTEAAPAARSEPKSYGSEHTDESDVEAKIAIDDEL
jgi:hypothetical protein